MKQSGSFPRRHYHGFTLVELLVVTAILAVTVIFAVMNFQKQLGKGYDTRRKSDIDMFRIAFEDFYNDHTCYPTQDEWDGYTCGSKDFSPYLEKFFCDPRTNEKYFYISDSCNGYRLYASLEIKTDADIARVGCGLLGCGYNPPLPVKYNYGIAVGGMPVAEDGFIANPTSAPTSIPPTVGPTPTLLPGQTPTLNPTLFPPDTNIVCTTNNDCGAKENIEDAYHDGCGQTFVSDVSCHNAGCCGGCIGSSCDCVNKSKPWFICRE